MTELRRTTKRAVAVIALCLLVSVGFFSTEGPATQRILSEEADAGTAEEHAHAKKGPLQQLRLKTSATCEVREPMRRPVPPTLASSYPGSGDEDVDRLVQAITGLSTGHDSNDEGGQAHTKQAVTIKTHFPSHTDHDTFSPYSEIDRAILLLRNPLYAIPSFHNHLYKAVLSVNGDRVQAPLEIWKKWRDENFDAELEKWKEHTHWWMQHYDIRHRLVIIYEDLMSIGAGPRVLKEIGEFLSFDPIVATTTTTSTKDLECLWNAVTASRQEDKPLANPFTIEQLQKMEDVLEELRERWIGPLGGLLSEYKASIREARVEILMDDAKIMLMLDEMKGLLRGEAEEKEGYA